MNQMIRMVNLMLCAFYLFKKKNGGKKEMDQIPLFGCKREQKCALYT